jgi:DNA-binding NarL/FixJ family response regulator
MTEYVYDFLKRKNLTDREVQATRELLAGLSNAAIASRMGISVKTVKFHLTTVFKKMEVKSRTELIVKCHKHSEEKRL